MRCFGYEDLPEKLNGAGVHSLDNIMTLGHTIHGWFDELQLWSEAVVRGLQLSALTLNVSRKESTYTIRVTGDTHRLSCKENPVVFKSAPSDLPLQLDNQEVTTLSSTD